MPLFFFHLRTGAQLDEDAVGVDLPDLDAARREALLAVADMVREAALTGTAVAGEAFDITDRDGRLVMSVPFGAPRDQGRVG